MQLFLQSSLSWWKKGKQLIILLRRRLDSHIVLVSRNDRELWCPTVEKMYKSRIRNQPIPYRFVKIPLHNIMFTDINLYKEHNFKVSTMLNSSSLVQCLFFMIYNTMLGASYYKICNFTQFEQPELAASFLWPELHKMTFLIQ